MSLELALILQMVLMLAGMGTMLFLILSMLSFLYGAPFVSSRRETVEAALRMAKLKKGDVFYDLGSGDGRVVLAASSLGAKATGVEINPFLWLWAASRSVLSGGKANFLLASFFDVNLRDADAVFVYTWQGTNEKLQGKLRDELRKGARVVSHRFTFPGWKPAAEDEKNRLFLYVK